MKKLTTQQWIDEANKVHNFRYGYSKVSYKDSNSLVEIECYTHGFFFQEAGNHLYRKSNCTKCTTAVLYTKEEWVNKANKFHKNKYNYSESVYVGIKRLIEIHCPEHGYFWQRAEKHLTGGCSSCANNRPFTLQEFINKSNITHNFKYNYSLVDQLNGLHSKVNIICPKHGKFLQTANAHMYGRNCKHCKPGNSSEKERVWLDSKFVPNDDKHRNVIIKIKDKKFCVDGIVNNIIYEFLGDYWHGHPITFDPNKVNSSNKKRFSDLFNNTVEKIRFLRANGYKVISIWERDFDKGFK